MNEHDLKNLITKRLNAVTDNVSPNDFNIIRSSWRSDPHFGGAYTYGSINSKPKHW